MEKEPMNSQNALSGILAAVALVLGMEQAALAQNADGTPADNTRSNKLDANNGAATADAQKDDRSDRTTIQRIRKSLMADKSLSTYAHNVKIISINGTVTLNGVVRSDREKSAIAAKAASVAGDGHVVNELKVAPPNS